MPNFRNLIIVVSFIFVKATTKPTPKPTTKPPHPPKNVCDWPLGTCTYKYDKCPPDWERCPQYDSGCKLATNHCCCRKKTPPGKWHFSFSYQTAFPCKKIKRIQSMKNQTECFLCHLFYKRRVKSWATSFTNIKI